MVKILYPYSGKIVFSQAFIVFGEATFSKFIKR